MGHIAGIRDVIGFHGESVTELRSAFMEAVDDYLETCQRLTQATATFVSRQYVQLRWRGRPTPLPITKMVAVRGIAPASTAARARRGA